MEEERRTRIFMGGLGGSVTADDIRTTFSSLGTVTAVELVRTKGRSFAYLDFLPSSPKSLPKLFSTYNGCVWKGGKLRLEKAKEHYLVRLRQEWAGDAELASSARNGIDADKMMAPSEKPKKVLNAEKVQLRIFFPRLRKVKSLPFSGTGKHKYSFQRVEVPALPVHFCDCEEHSDAFYTATGKHFCNLEAQSGGINEEELNMMNSVMNKLLERENDSKAACSGTGLVKGEDNSIKSIDDLPISDHEDLATDEDNLIINIVTGGNNRTALLGSQEQETISANQELRFNKPQTSRDGPTQKMLNAQKRKIVPSNKKRKSLLAEESDRNELASPIPKRRGSLQTHLNKSETQLVTQPTESESGTKQSTTHLSWSQKSSWRELVGEKGNSPFSISHVLPSIASAKEEKPKSDALKVPKSSDSEDENLVKHGNWEGQSGKSKELEGLAEVQPTEPNAVVNKSARGASWLQKSSWTQLVGETNNSSFSISQILPGITFEKQELLKPNGLDIANSTESKHLDLVKQDLSKSAGDGSKDLRVGKEGLLTASGSNMVGLDKKEQNFAAMDVELSTPQKNLQIVIGNNEVSSPILGEKHHLAPNQTYKGEIGIGGNCSFMRSAASVKEWVNTKAALSASLKKKSNEK